MGTRTYQLHEGQAWAVILIQKLVFQFLKIPLKSFKNSPAIVHVRNLAIIKITKAKKKKKTMGEMYQ